MDYSNECSLVRDRAVVAAREEIRLFCRILGYPNNDLNHLISDDPHGIVDMQEGYRVFNMTDIHVLIADYARWLAIYKDNQTLRKVVDEWYYWTLEQKEQYKAEFVSVSEVPIDEVNFVIGFNKAWIDEDFNPKGVRMGFMSNGEFISAYWWDYQDDFIAISKSICESNPDFFRNHIENTEPTHWAPIPPTAKPQYCNLKNWLMGWRPKPEDCLPYYNEHQAQEQAAAQKRVEQAKADLNEAADEFNANKQF